MKTIKTAEEERIQKKGKKYKKHFTAIYFSHSKWKSKYESLHIPPHFTHFFFPGSDFSFFFLLISNNKSFALSFHFCFFPLISFQESRISNLTICWNVNEKLSKNCTIEKQEIFHIFFHY